MTGALADKVHVRALAREGVGAASCRVSKPASRLPAFAGLSTLLIAFSALSLATPLAARPLSKCRLGNQSEYGSVSDGTLTDEKRKELRLRVLVDALDDVDIVFRGRLTSRKYLSDIYQTYVPLILEVYDGAVVLKGSLPATLQDGKVFLIREKQCDGGCRLRAFPEVADGIGEGERERVVLAMNNTLANPAEGRDRWTNQVVYRGRIDALLGPCDPYLINDAAAAALVSAPQEMARLRLAYPPRTAEDKRRDEQLIINKFMFRPEAQAK
jgi:hypothetical protein